jgi:signal transduction histidine kinase
MLAQARQEVSDVLGEVRRLVYGLRPPALDDVGLAGAIRQQVERLHSPELRVALQVRGSLDELPAAVEVAALRIVSEALANAARHAGGSSCSVIVEAVPGLLVVEVTDDGRGIAPDVRAGVGLISLRERAEELGGRCRVTGAPGGGTRVRAELPTAGREGDEEDRHAG